MKHIDYSKAEEKLNFITHAVAMVFSIVGFVILMAIALHHHKPDIIVSYAVYGFSLMMLYLSSTLYHYGFSPRVRYFFRITDHCSIYLLIAGTYTPVLLLGLGGKLGWALMITIWSMAFAGILFKTKFVHKYNLISTIAYVLMAWLCILFAKQLIDKLPKETLIWLLIGGGFYTFGVLFYLWHKLYHNHGIWHVFVFLGSLAHFIAVIYLVVP